jgi:hypothetical protein
MSKLARWSIRLGAAVLGAAISVVSNLIYIAVRPTPQVALTANLSGAWDTVSAEFDRRIKSRFPVGSAEAEMGNELRREGFSREDWTSSVSSEHEAVRREDNWVCRQAAHVYWHADADGHVTAIEGRYREEGCL